MIDHPEQAEHGKDQNKRDIKAAMEISSFLGDLGIRILPGKEWAVHYKNPQRRNEILQGVLTGQLTPDQVDLTELPPLGMTYRLQDMETLGLDGLIGQVRDRANFYKYFDYRGFLDFLAGLAGREVDLETAVQLFSSVSGSRIQSELLRTLGATGKNQLKSSLRNEAETIVHTENIGKMRSLLELLKLRWLRKQGIISPTDVEPFESKAGTEIVELANALEDSYGEYVQKGDHNAKTQLANTVRNSFAEIQEQVKADQLDEFVQNMLENYDQLPPDTKREIDNAFNDYQPPCGDILPDAKNRQDLSMSEMQDVAEGEKVDPLYTVEPPLTGLYQGQIYSLFNPAQLEWEINSTLQVVTPVNKPREHLMRGKKINGRSTVVLYVPRYFVPVSIPASLQMLQDQNGTYYLRNTSDAPVHYEVGFSKHDVVNRTPPTSDESADIAHGGLSMAILNFLRSLHGKPNIEKAQALIHYMKNVLGLQYSTDSQYNRIYKSNPSRYFLEIEKHKQVDCKVAQTYFIALCRLAGVPSRLVTGHSVDLVDDGKAILHSGTGHAWTEIWDERSGSWQTIDATPEKEDQDEKSKQSGQGVPKEEADIPAPPKDRSKDALSSEEVKKKVDDQVEETQQGSEKPGGSSFSVPDAAKKKMENMINQTDSQDSSGASGNGEKEVSDAEWNELEKKMEASQKQHQEMTQKSSEIQAKIQQSQSFRDFQALEKELEEAELYDEAKENLERMLEAKEEQTKKILQDEIEKMQEDGFITEEQAEKLLHELEDDQLKNYTKIEQQLERESALYNAYEEIREEVMPLVDEWFAFFADRLPKIEEIDYDEDTRTRSGHFDRRSISRPRNFLFGQTQNPLIVTRSTMPRFMASLVIDISGSMSSRMKDARKLLIFFSELFDKISKEFGYIKFSISAFDTAVELIKDFDYEYHAPTRYDFGGSEKTVKMRLMEMTMARGGTDMGKAVWDANKKLNEEKFEHPDYLSALYTISDGETGGELAGENLRRFLDGEQSFWGEWWGEHMKCGFMLGPERQKAVLSQYFGEDNSEAVPDIRDLIEKVMNRFDEDVQSFIEKLPED